MSLIDKVATVSIALAGYLTMCKYVDVLRGKKPQTKAEQDLVRAWDELIRSYEAEKELEEMKAEAAVIEKQQQQFDKKWERLLPGKKE